MSEQYEVAGRMCRDLTEEEAAKLIPIGITPRKSLGGTVWQDHAYRELVKSAKTNHVEVDMTVHEMPPALPKYCAIFTSERLDPRTKGSYVRKRINERAPYSKANLIFISRKAFSALRVGLSLHELKQLVQFYEEYEGELVRHET